MAERQLTQLDFEIEEIVGHRTDNITGLIFYQSSGKATPMKIHGNRFHTYIPLNQFKNTSVILPRH